MAGISSISAATLDPSVVAAAAELNLVSEQAALSASVSELASGVVGGTLDVIG